MTDLRDPLEDLVSEVGSYVVPDAHRAWTAGARRRARRRFAAAGLVAAAVVVVAGLVTQLPRSGPLPPAGDPGSRVEGYPSHVDAPWPWARRDLPARPGPLAGLLRSGSSSVWFAVAPDGHSWRVPQPGAIDDFPPALSDDGRMIGYLAGETTYVVRDLVTGEETRFPDIGDNRSVPREETYYVSAQQPGFWSADGSRLLLPAARWDDDRRAGFDLVLDVDGSVREVRSHGFRLGWLDDDALAWLDVRGRTASLVTTDLDGEVRSEVPIELTPRAVGRLSQWSASLSPERDLMAIALANATGTVLTVSTTDGSAVRRENVGAGDTCPLAWSGEEVAFFQTDGSAYASLDTTTGARLIVVDPRFEATCVLAAADALAGERHRSLGERMFGDTWLSWRWREVGSGLLGGLVLVAGLVTGLVVRRRRRSAREDDRDPGDGAGGAAPGDPAVVE